jgi:hypothetical protein
MRQHRWMNSKELAAATGLGDWVVAAIKKANAELAKAGKEELIFRGRDSTPARVTAWLELHPTFSAADVKRRGVLPPAVSPAPSPLPRRPGL